MHSISVILPNYNHSHFIGKQLTALINQSMRPSEIIVIDDGSTDDSVNVISEFTQRFDFVRLIRNEQNIGISKSVQRALPDVKSDFLFFASANDLVSIDLFSTALDLMNRYPQAGVFSAMIGHSFSTNEVNAGFVSSHPIIQENADFISPELALKTLQNHDSWFHGNTAVYRRSIFERLGCFDQKLGSFTDAFFFSVVALKHGVTFSPRELVSVNQESGGYAESMTGDPHAALKMFNYARSLMTGKYCDLFPDDYVKTWDGRWRFTIANNLLAKGNTPSEDILVLFTAPGPFDRVLVSSLPLLGPIGKQILKYYLIGTLTPADFRSALIKALLPSRLRR